MTNTMASIEHELKTASEAFRSGNLPEATVRVETLYRTHPDRPDVQMAKGLIEMAQGNQERALELLSSSLRAEPDNAEALAWAAFVALNLHRFQEAEGFARRLSEVAARNPRGFYLLANALRGLDRIQEALDAIDNALALAPDDTDSLVTKARLLKRWQMPGLAIELYRQALAIRPSPPAAVDLAQILLQEGRPEEALRVLESAEAQLPEAGRPYALKAQAYTEMRRFEEAEGEWLAAQRFGRDPAALVKRRASAEIAVGRFAIGEQLLAEAIDKGLAAASCFYLLTTARKMTGEDGPLLERMEGLAGRGGFGKDEAIELNFGLGKAYDDLKQYQRAIGFYNDANRLSYELYPKRRSFDREEVRRTTDFQIGYFTADRIRWLQAQGLDSGLPLFVVGMMRSGTTLTESILSAHSKVKGLGEQAFWTERGIEFLHWEDQELKLDFDLVRKFATEYLALVDPKNETIRYVLDKNPGNIDLAAMLHCIYPNAKIVHLKRHPVDNLLSMWMTPVSGNVGYASDRENLVFKYREYLRLLKHLNQVLPENRFTTIRYEELTSQPEQTIGWMLDFLGLDREPACFAPEANVRTVLTPSVGQVRQPIHEGSQARWRNYEPWLGTFAELLEEPEWS